MSTIPLNELLAVNLASGTEATRYYLNGVFIEWFENGAIRLVATDGHRLHLIDRGGEVTETDSPVKSTILSNESIKELATLANLKLKTLPKGEKCLGVSLALDIGGDGNISVTASCGNMELSAHSFKPIDGTFPNYRRVIPPLSVYKKGAGTSAFNARYLADFGKAAKLLGCRLEQITIYNHESNGPARVLIQGKENEFLGILMPVRF
jgi:DNA polymerase III sliding clamp (beta) subunit (PCNA family)